MESTDITVKISFTILLTVGDIGDMLDAPFSI